MSTAKHILTAEQRASLIHGALEGELRAEVRQQAPLIALVVHSSQDGL